jgi:hypothetical protein
MVKTSVMWVTRCRICRFEMGAVAGGQGSGGPARANWGPCGRGPWWASGRPAAAEPRVNGRDEQLFQSV